VGILGIDLANVDTDRERVRDGDDFSGGGAGGQGCLVGGSCRGQSWSIPIILVGVGGVIIDGQGRGFGGGRSSSRSAVCCGQWGEVLESLGRQPMEHVVEGCIGDG
jgi:hypothetical protein